LFYTSKSPIGTPGSAAVNIQGPFRDHSGNIQGAFREHSGSIQGNILDGCAKPHRALRSSSWKSSATTSFLQVRLQGTFRGRSTSSEHSGKINQGAFREHSGNIQGTFKEDSGNIQGACAKLPRALR
jgi:hypothetical protein